MGILTPDELAACPRCEKFDRERESLKSEIRFLREKIQDLELEVDNSKKDKNNEHCC